MVASPRDLLVSASSALGVQVYTAIPAFSSGFWGSSQGPHVCVAKTLLTELSPQLSMVFTLTAVNTMSNVCLSTMHPDCSNYSIIVIIVYFLTEGFSVYTWLSWNSLCGPGWP